MISYNDVTAFCMKGNCGACLLCTFAEMAQLKEEKNALNSISDILNRMTSELTEKNGGGDA